MHGDLRGRFVEIFRTAVDAGGVRAVATTRTRRAACFAACTTTGIRPTCGTSPAGRAQVGLADLRRRGGTPPTETLVLDAAEPTTVFIPRGVAHGYLALTEIDLIYWVTGEYDPADEHGVAWNDPTLAIPWQLDGEPVVSERDAQNPGLEWELVPVVLVTGAGGQVGLALRAHLPEAAFLARAELDVTDAAAVAEAVGRGRRRHPHRGHDRRRRVRARSGDGPRR